MGADTTLPPGANVPLQGQTVRITLKVPQLGGAAIVIEPASGGPRLVGAAEGFARIEPAGDARPVVHLDLAAVPADIERLRVMVWSPGPTLGLARAEAIGLTDADQHFAVVLPEAARELRAAELVELYRRAGAWKVRAVASGWMDHLAGLAAAVGLPVSAFPAPAPAPRPEPAAPASPPTPPELHEGPSPAVGPPALREALDMVVGPGARAGDDTFVDFALHGVFMRLTYEASGDYARVVATTPAGEGKLTDAVALAALRATGEAPLGRVSFDEDDAAFVSAPAIAERHQVDSALIKALLAEAWVTAARLATRVRTARWRFSGHPTEPVPRELRLGVGEALQEVDAWQAVQERLLEAGCMPLVDAPAALLAPTDLGQLVAGPSMLAGTPRGWTILVERTVRANVRPQPGLWTELARHNGAEAFLRCAVQPEGLPGDPPAIVVGYSALQLPRTQVMEDLARGLDLVNEGAERMEPLLLALAADSADYRNNLPWPAGRPWAGPGSEPTQGLLVREIAELPAGADVPAKLVGRVRAQAQTLGRPGIGYLAHLAVSRAEAGDAVAADWRSVARDLVALVPVAHPEGEAPCATASVHVRLHRLDQPRPMRPPPPPPSPPLAPRGLRDLFR